MQRKYIPLLGMMKRNYCYLTHNKLYSYPCSEFKCMTNSECWSNVLSQLRLFRWPMTWMETRLKFSFYIFNPKLLLMFEPGHIIIQKGLCIVDNGLRERKISTFAFCAIVAVLSVISQHLVGKRVYKSMEPFHSNKSCESSYLNHGIR